MKKVIAILTVLALVLALAGAALAEELSYEGTVVAGETIPIAAPFGGRMGKVPLREGDPVQEGDIVANILTTMNYSPVEGTVTGLYADEGDATEGVKERYGAVMYIEPTRKYTVEATSEKAYNASENYFLHHGERVYLTCFTDGSHQGTGVITAITDTGYTIEVTGGEFVLNEKVYVNRSENREKEKRIGSGKVKRSKPVEVTGTGSVLKLHVKSPVTGVVSKVEKNAGDTVAKGETLMKVIPSKSFQVQFDVPEGDLFSLQEGQAVTMQLNWDDTVEKTYPGKIVSIARMNEEVKESTDKKVYKAYASFEADERIRLGMTMLIYADANGAPAEAEPAETEPAETEAPEE